MKIIGEETCLFVSEEATHTHTHAYINTHAHAHTVETRRRSSYPSVSEFTSALFSARAADEWRNPAEHEFNQCFCMRTFSPNVRGNDDQTLLFQQRGESNRPLASTRDRRCSS